MKNSGSAFCLILALLAGCKSYDTTGTDKDFKIIEATALQWYGGVEGSGNGIQYLVKSIVMTNKHLDFDSVWVDQRVYVPIVLNTNAIKIASFSQGDTVSLIFNYQKAGDPDLGDGAMLETPPKSTGPTFAGDGLILYRLEGGRRIKAILEIKRLESQFYP